MVDDSGAKNFQWIEGIALETSLNVELLSNRRRNGLSGALNTALDHLLRLGDDPHDVYVSFLDDDDFWDADYLAGVASAIEFGADMVAGSLLRIDAKCPEGRLKSPPSSLRAEEFLAGNPGIQGSNLTVRLSSILKAGLFDEALSSCTDRDVCIRLSDLGAIYAPAPFALVFHDTSHGGERLSDPGSRSKLQGLSKFFAKYRLRMTPETVNAFHERAKALFGWEEASRESDRLPPSSADHGEPVRSSSKLDLVVAIIVDGNRLERCLPLIRDLGRLATCTGVGRFDVVLLENGDASGFDTVVACARNIGLSVWPARLSDQQEIVPFHLVKPPDITRDKPIAVSRSLLQQFAFVVSEVSDKAPVWILDDDFRLEGEPEDIVTGIVACREQGFDVVLGGNTGSAPVPASSVVRTQLVDVVHLLTWAAGVSLDRPFPEASLHNLPGEEAGQDYHYDLTRDGTHNLETPFLPPSSDGNIGKVVEKVLGDFERIFAGEAVTRPILPRMTAPVDNLARGGNTVVFRTDLLRDVPNMSPRRFGRPVRRSDMIWAADCRYRFGASVKACPLPMLHDRSKEKMGEDDSRRLLDDIIGYGFFSAYREILDESATEGAPSVLPDIQPDRLRILTEKYVTERLAAYRLSYWRILGLGETLDRLVDYGPWWLPAIGTEERARFEVVRAQLRKYADFDKLRALEAEIGEVLSDGIFETFLNDLECFYAKSDSADNPGLIAWCRSGRETRAKEFVRHHLGRAADRCLGMGAEGVVLKCGDRVVKVFDRWTEETRTSKCPEISALVGLDTFGALPDITAVHNSWEFLAIEYRFEESEPYSGGHGPEVAHLLMRLGQANLVHSNVNPKNLRMTSRGLQLIDIGKSIEQATEDGREMMLRRAFLSWRFAFREDLAQLHRHSLRENPIPELTGHEALKEAVHGLAPKHRLDAELFAKLGSTRAASVLDYGCGKPRVPYIPTGMVAFDIDPGLKAKWGQSAPGVAFWSRPDLDKALGRSAKFDAILCSLVLCSVDDEEVFHCLGDMRRLVADTGKLLVAICDPGAIHVEQAVEQVRLNTGKIRPRSSCTYGKFIRATGNTRIEHHRSLDAYRRAFAKSGFAVLHEEVVFGTDLDRFERVPEFRIFELSPLPALRQRTALLIKLCAMEADSAEQQVRHLVGQLSFPRRFDEIALLIDPFTGPFPRQHTAGDIVQLRAVARRLETEGIVDRVIDGLVDGDKVEEAAMKWTGLSTRFAHCANGQPALSFLEAFAGLGVDYVLHADADVLIGRPDRQHDHILEAVEYMEANPDVISLALPVLGYSENSAERTDAAGVPFRVEAICGWVAVDRLQRSMPLPANLKSGRLELSWHRMVDTAIREGRGSSVRKGSRGIWFAAVDNTRKADDQTSALLMDRVEAGYAPPLQQGRPLVAGTVRDWSGPARAEEMVLVICGRNVRSGAVERCFASLRAQTFQGWGAVVVDDASDAPCWEAQKLAVAEFGSRITHIKRQERAGLLANTYMAVRDVVVSPEIVIVTLDMDDALASPDALKIVLERHRSGADLTVGSMVRTDKKVSYPANFNRPRANRGGNVWQHLRSFRKHLFDRIPVEDVKPGGEWVELANDWSFMLPMTELARKPEQIEEVIYLHEPSTSPRPIAEVMNRETVISRICSLPEMAVRPGGVPDCTVLCYHRFLPDREPTGTDSFYLRRGMAVRQSSLRQQLMDLNGTYNPVSIHDYVLALRGERTLPERSLLVTVDDGYRDFQEIALPMFQNAGIEPVMFSRIPVEDGYPDWAPLDLFYCAMGKKRANADILDADWLAWRENLLRQPVDRQLQMVEASTGSIQDEMRSERERLYLSGAELNGVQGATICGHGTSHVRWTNLELGSLRAVLRQCADWLDRMKSPRVVAYPDGSCDATIAAELLNRAFDAAFVIGASNRSMPARFGIGRIIVPDDPDFFSARTDVATEVVA